MHSRKLSLSLCVVLLVVAAGCGRKTDPGATTGTTGTTGTTTLKVTDVTLGRAIGGATALSDSTDKFPPYDTIYAWVTTDGSAPSATLRARWTFEDGQRVDESSRTTAPNNRERTEF